MSNLTTHELDSPPWLRVESTLMATARLVRVAFDTRLAPLDLNLTQASLLGYVTSSAPRRRPISPTTSASDAPPSAR